MAYKKGKGWRNEPLRHSLARKGVKTGRKGRQRMWRTPLQIRNDKIETAEILLKRGWTVGRVSNAVGLSETELKEVFGVK